MAIDRRSALTLLGSMALGLPGRPAFAGGYPDRQVRYIIPYIVGGGADTMARLVGPIVSQSLGQSFVPENQGGASGSIGAALIARSRPDGYTIMMAAANLAIGQSLYKSLPFDVFANFAPVTLMAKTPSILAVTDGFPAHSLQDLIALAKAAPGKYNYASDQAGPQALGMALLKAGANIDLTNIPYTGTGGGTIAVLGGHVDMILAPANILTKLVRGGQLRAIAVTSAQRLDVLPDVPTVAESGLPGFDVNQWYGVFAPHGTPKPIVDKLSSAFVQAMKSPAIQDVMHSQVMIPVGNSPEEFATFLDRDVAQWGEAIKAAHLPQI